MKNLKILVLLSLILMFCFMFFACVETNEPQRSKSPGKRETFGPDNLYTYVPTSPPERTPAPNREDLPLAVIKKVNKSDNTITLAFYDIEDSVPIATSETAIVEVDKKSHILFGDIFSYTLGSFTNKRAELDFFLDNATKKYEKKPLYFFVQINDNYLQYAELWSEYYFD